MATLELVQIKAIRIITNIYNKTSNPASNIEAGMLPLKLQLELLIRERLLLLVMSTNYLQFTKTNLKREYIKFLF